MNELDGAILINFLTKAIDIDLDEIGFAVEVAVPNMLHDFTASNQLRCPQQKQLEKGKLSGGRANSLEVSGIVSLSRVARRR